VASAKTLVKALYIKDLKQVAYQEQNPVLNTCFKLVFFTGIYLQRVNSNNLLNPVNI